MPSSSRQYTDSFRKRNVTAIPKTIVPNPKGTAVCGVCGAIYERKRWYEDAARSRELRLTLGAEVTVCPACVRAKAKMPEGILTASGAFVKEHHDEILHTIVASAKRERAHDTLCRLLDVKSSPEGIVVTTANERLVRKLGHVLHSAFHGELNFVFSHDDRLTRVRWHRDDLGHRNDKANGKKYEKKPGRKRR